MSAQFSLSHRPMTASLAAIILYFSFLVWIGIISRKKRATDRDFALGNRALNFWVTAISAHADDMSSWLFMAFPAALFLSGPYKLWVGMGLIIGMFCNWHFIAPRLRAATEKYDSHTLSTFFERRFGDTSGIIRYLSALVTIFFLTYYLSAGLVATGRLFESLFAIDYYIGITLAIGIMVSYVFTGGFVSVAWTDFAQGLFLLAVILIVPAFAVWHVGGSSPILTSIAEKGMTFSLIPDFSLLTLLAIFSLSVGWGLGYCGQPHILTKFMAIKEVSDLRKSKYLGMSWQILALASAAAIGLIGIAFFPEGLHKPEMVFVEMSRLLFPPFLTALVICGIFAANMSTMDAQIIVCATVLSEDFYKRTLNKNASPQQVLMASRLGVLIFAAIAFCMAYGQSASIMSIVEYAWSGLGSAFGPLVLVALYSKTANRYGAIAGILTGGSIAALWPTLNPLITPVEIIPMIPSFFCSLASIYGFSYLTRERTPVLPI